MKKIKLFILLIASSAWLQGQGYVPLIDSSKTWNVAHIYPHGGGANTVEYYFGDTISIENTLYVKVKVKEKMLNRQADKGNILGYMREDTESRKVYFRSPYDDKSILLYDFSLEEGDTVQLYGDNGIKYTVLQTDSIELHNGEVRKRWVFSLQHYYENATWIEGIGNITIDLLNPGDFDGSTTTTLLLCSYENQELVYMNDEYNTCLLNWVNITETNNETIGVFPNPAKDHITISAEPGAKSEVRMYNIQGGLLLKKQIENHETIDISHFDPGLFFVRIVDNKNNASSFKIVKL